MEASKVKYLFTEESHSFPVVEFLASPDESLNIPSFILETTWPRVVYFYYPNRNNYQYFHNDYVQIARRIRSESDILVLFYAISCAAHSSMCVNTDLVQITNRPILKAYESESMQGKEILIESPISTIENANNILHQLCQSLSIGDSIGEFHHVKSNLQDSRDNHSNPNPAGQTLVRGIEKKSNEKILQDTFIDAQKAFILTLEYNIYDNLVDENNDGSNRKSILTKPKAEILRDFLDLCYWTLPPDWKIQEVILALRTDFSSITNEREYLLSVLSGVQELKFDTWSESCTLPTYGREITNGIDRASYSCALWKLLHIIAVGATESHSHVMGDTARTKPTYVAWVIRDFIAEFMPDYQYDGGQGHGLKWCQGCRESVIKSFDECAEGILCFHDNDQKSVSSLASRTSYESISKWIWSIQKSTMPVTKIQSNNDKYFTYDKVKMDYWPSNLKIVRVSVLKRFKRKLPIFEKSSKNAKGQSAYLNLTIIMFIGLCVLMTRRIRGSYSMTRKEK